MEKPVSGLNRSVKQVNKNDHAFVRKPEADNINDEIVEWILMNRKLELQLLHENYCQTSTIKVQLK